jgi:hypothetical protein
MKKSAINNMAGAIQNQADQEVPSIPLLLRGGAATETPS